jgi:drug/metabolite transporter (DMT)-like permease
VGRARHPAGPPADDGHLVADNHRGRGDSGCRVTAVLLALGAAATFGAMTVAVRLGMRGGGAGSASLAVLLSALLVALVGAIAAGHDMADAWRFFLAGLLAPGVSQLLFTRAVAEVGAARASAAVGAGPLVALAFAFVFLREPVELSLIVGGVAIVAGGVLLAAEPGRPSDLRGRGLLYAFAAAVCFATRDNIVRALHAHGSPETVAAATILAGVIVAACASRRLPRRGELVRLAPAGLLFGLSYLLLFGAYFHGRVSVVSPLVATETLWGVGLAALLIGGNEGLARRALLGTAAILAGGVVIGVSAVG